MSVSAKEGTEMLVRLLLPLLWGRSVNTCCRAVCVR